MLTAEITPILVFGAGMVVQAALSVVRGGDIRKSVPKLLGSLGVAILVGLLPGKHEANYVLRFHVASIVLIFPFVTAVTFMTQLIGEINEPLILIFGLVRLYLIANHSIDPLIHPTVITAILEATTALVALMALWNPKLPLWVKALLYIYFLVLSVSLLAHEAYVILRLFSGVAGGLGWRSLFVSGMASFYLLAQSCYLLMLIPIPGRHQTMQARLAEWHEEVVFFGERMEPEGSRLRTILVVLAATVALAANGRWRFFADATVTSLLLVFTQGLITPSVPTTIDDAASTPLGAGTETTSTTPLPATASLGASPRTVGELFRSAALTCGVTAAFFIGLFLLGFLVYFWLPGLMPVPTASVPQPTGVAPEVTAQLKAELGYQTPNGYLLESYRHPDPQHLTVGRAVIEATGDHPRTFVIDGPLSSDAADLATDASWQQSSDDLRSIEESLTGYFSLSSDQIDRQLPTTFRAGSTNCPGLFAQVQRIDLPPATAVAKNYFVSHDSVAVAFCPIGGRSISVSFYQKADRVDAQYRQEGDARSDHVDDLTNRAPQIQADIQAILTGFASNQ